ncbi:hypothetical protein VTO58DRAFT_110391 [Aureobasidium pullulans]|nr:hypothetical protein JADG_002662 [Aureobasidium pullulans]
MCTIMEGHREVTSCSREFMEKFLENMLEWQPHLQVLDPDRQHVKIFSVDEISDWLKLQDEEDERLREIDRELEELRKEQAARELEQALVDSRRLPSPEPSHELSPEPSPEPDYSLPDWHPSYPLAPGPPGRHFYYESDSDIDKVKIPPGTVIRPLWANRHSDEHLHLWDQRPRHSLALTSEDTIYDLPGHKLQVNSITEAVLFAFIAHQTPRIRWSSRRTQSRGCASSQSKSAFAIAVEILIQVLAYKTPRAMSVTS